MAKFIPINVADQVVIPVEQISVIANDVKGFIDRTTSVIKFTSDTQTDADIAEAEVSENRQDKDKSYTSFNTFVDDLDGYLTRFSEIVYNSTDFVRNPSVRDSRGNKFYKFHESTWGDDVISTLIDMKKNKHFSGTKGSNSFRSLPKHLLTDYYQDNIFVNGLNYIAAKGMHEASKNVDNGSVTPLTRENLFFFYHREFVQGFLDGMRQYGNEYFMYTYPPSDKPKHPLARVKVLSEEEIRSGIKSALTQILNTQGTTSNIVKYNKTVKDNLFQNFTVAKEALANLGYEVLTAENLDEVASEVESIFNSKAETILKDLLSDEVQLTFDVRTYDIFRNHLVSKLDKKIVNGKTLSYDFPTTTFRNKDYASGEAKYIVDVKEISPAFRLFYKNHYINNYFYNQLITGDYHFYPDAATLVKRYAGVLAPGIKPLVDPVLGSDNNYRMLVLSDTSIPKSETTAVLKNLLHGDQELSVKEQKDFDRLMKFFSDKGYDRSDAQGFMLPSRFNNLTRGYGRAWGMGNVMKPVYFEVQPQEVEREDGTKFTTAKPIYVKYSSIVLTDELVNEFPILRVLRDRMEEVKVDELTFESAVKVGYEVKESLTLRDFLDNDDVKNLDLSVLNLSNRNFRFQHNAAADPEKNIAIYSQLMYFLNLQERKSENYEAARIAYKMVAELIKQGREEFLGRVDSLPKIRKLLLRKFNGPGAERALDLLSAGLSLSQPLLEKKAIVSLASSMAESTIKIKFSGGKLVLQSSEGARIFGDLDADTEVTYDFGRELEYGRTTIEGISTMYAEVVVPRELLTTEQIKSIEMGTPLFIYGDGIGFRIPSTELHSAIPLKIVGVYAGKSNNVIIAPKELVPIHGSDFDVDALFIIKREVHTKENASFVPASVILANINSYVELQNEIQEAIALVSSPTDQAILTKFQNEIDKKTNLLLDPSTRSEEMESPTFQSDTEASYQEFISTLQYSKKFKKKVIRKELPDFKDYIARHEFAVRNGLYYERKS